jgi:single-strand DNA-binding protein
MAFETNTASIYGRLVRDPEISYIGDGKACAKFGIANQTGKKDNDKTLSFLDCVAWGKTAESVQQFCTKGSPVVVTGAVTQSRWTSKEGQSRSKVEINCNKVQFVGGGKGADSGQAPGTGSSFNQQPPSDPGYPPEFDAPPSFAPPAPGENVGF